ncbi:O-antigen ligase family protein [Microvirga sp. TS319]|uniref:O-antigen ligase family protein n=1 Tax=Microvirga sp. TS319 TaxID=3241165 RepID=UPI00351A0D0F
MFSISSRLTYAALWLRKQHAGQDWLNSVSAAAFLVFVVASFFIPGHALPVGAIVLMAILALFSGAGAAAFTHSAWLVLFGVFFSAWVALGGLIGGPGYNISDFFNLVLLGAFFLSVAQVSRALSTRQILSVIAIAGGASACAALLLHIVSADDLFDRLFPLGRGRNPIPGAGGFAVALIAFAALWLDRPPVRRVASLHLFLIVTLLLGLAWTQSRAPIIALALALPLALWLSRRGGTAAVLLACGGIWIAITGLGMLEPMIKAIICDSDADWCRPSFRSEIWGWVREQIVLHPMLGTGPSFRFQKTWMSHPHNGLFGTAMYYGLMALLAFWAMIGFYARQLTRQEDRSLRFFGLASILFSFGYMGTDLSNPFAFFNMHYLFLWLPLFLVLTPSQATTRREGGVPLPGTGELRQI